MSTMDTVRSENQGSWGWDHTVAATAALIALAVYLATLARTVTGEDSGELITAAWSLGIPHPPGYPLWCLMAHPFTWLPFGTVAWRVAFFSACCAAATVYGVVILTRSLGMGRLAAFAAGLALAFSREFWEQAIIAEVYALNALCVVLCLLLLFAWHASRSKASLIALAVVYGLSLGNHGTMVLLGPMFALYVLMADRPRQWGLYLGLTALAAATCFLIYTYLPLRSLADPPIDWGNPETLSNWWNVVRREQFAFIGEARPRSWPRFARQLEVFAGLWWREFTPWVGIIGLGGLLFLALRRPWHGSLLLMTAIVSLAGFSYLQNFDRSVEWVWVMTVFGIPAYLVTAVGLGVALEMVGRLGTPGALAAPVLAALCIASPLFAHGTHNNRSASFTAEDYARNMMTPLAPNAIVITETDAGAFAGLYLHVVEGLRPDVTLGRVNGYLAPALLAGAPQSLLERVGPFPRRGEDPAIFAWLLANSERPIYFERRPRLPEAPDGLRWKRAGTLLWRALRIGETDTIDYEEAYRWRSLEEDVYQGDYTARAILLSTRIASAAEALRTKNYAAADKMLREGLEAYGRDVRSLNNVGTLYARHGYADRARSLFQEALDLDPDEKTVRKNLEQLSERNQRPAPEPTAAP